ncbi:MAG TPA: hypothetical protein VFH47_02395, partial [Candidatus Thermoplasmatota archaeon]|nr:hypothetical protein [Candidatus Thermoplasmatota archaeon]
MGGVEASASRIPAWMPRGYPLEEGQWRRRHRLILLLAWFHVPLLLGVGFALGAPWQATLLAAGAVAAFAALASPDEPGCPRWRRC